METPSLRSLPLAAFLALFLLPAGPALAGAAPTLASCSAAYARSKMGQTPVPEACGAVLAKTRGAASPEAAFDTEKKTFEDLKGSCAPDRTAFDAGCADFYEYAAKLDKNLGLRRTCEAAEAPAPSAHELEDKKAQCDLVADRKTPPTLDLCLQRGYEKNPAATTPQCVALLTAANRKLAAAAEDCPKPGATSNPDAVTDWAIDQAPALGVKPENLMLRCLARHGLHPAPESAAADVKAVAAAREKRESQTLAANAVLAAALRCKMQGEAQRLGQTGAAPCGGAPAAAAPQPVPLPRSRPAAPAVGANECKKNAGNGLKWDAKTGRCSAIPKNQCTAANVRWHDEGSRCLALTKADCGHGQILSRTRGCIDPRPAPPAPSAAARRARSASAPSPDNPFSAVAAFFAKLFSPPSRAKGCHPVGMPRYNCRSGEANCVCG